MSDDKNLFDLEEPAGVYDVTGLTFTTEALDSLTDHTHTYSSQDSDTRDTNALGVGQAEYAYLDPELMEFLGYDALETSFGNCFAIGLIDYDSEQIALIHADDAWDYGSKRKVQRAKQGIEVVSDITDAEFDQAKLSTGITRKHEPEGGMLSDIEDRLEENYEEVFVDTRGFENSLGVSLDGFYEPQNVNMSQGNTPNAVDRLRMATNNKLRDGTRKAVNDASEEQIYWDKHLSPEIEDDLIESRGLKYDPQRGEIRYNMWVKTGKASATALPIPDNLISDHIDDKVLLSNSSVPPEVEPIVKEINKTAREIYEELNWPSYRSSPVSGSSARSAR